MFLGSVYESSHPSWKAECGCGGEESWELKAPGAYLLAWFGQIYSYEVRRQIDCKFFVSIYYSAIYSIYLYYLCFIYERFLLFRMDYTYNLTLWIYARVGNSFLIYVSIRLFCITSWRIINVHIVTFFF